MNNNNLLLVIILIGAAFGFYMLYEKNQVAQQQAALLATHPISSQVAPAAGNALAGLITGLGTSATSWLSSLGSFSGSPAGSAAPVTSGSNSTQVGPQNGSAPVLSEDVNSTDYTDLADENSFDDSESL